MDPVSVAAADVNGDGKLDLICANYSDDTLTVLTNNGSGSFGSNATLNVIGSPVSVVVADVNGDGKPDLVSVSGSPPVFAGILTVFTNNGGGVFGINATLNVGSHPSSVAVADVNGDGKPDLISANFLDNTLTVLTNNGRGIFSSNATLNVGNGPISVIAADVNGNSKLELVCANFGDNTLTVLTNNGSGSFGSNATLNVGSNPYCVIAANIVGNGALALITANGSDGTLTVLTNNGWGVFGSNATLNVGYEPNSVVAADVNGDGKLDLISANHGSYPSQFLDHTLTVLTNDGSGTFGSNATLQVGSGPNCVIAADVKANGKLDLISANGNDNTLTVLINISTFPSPTSMPSLSLNLHGNALQVAWPSDSPGWSLQENSDLTKTNWLPSGYGGYSIIDDGTNKNLILPSPIGNKFFRLLHP